MAERLTRIDIAVGEALGEQRRRSGQPVESLARAAGLSASDLASSEAGDRRLSASELFQLCQALGIPVGHLFAGLDDDRGPPFGGGGAE